MLWAFFNCHGLTDVVIGEGVETIGNYGLGYCDNLRSVHLGSNIKNLEGAFRYYDMSKTSKLEAVYFTGDVPVMNKYTFDVDITAPCYYPAGNRTWTEAVMQNYGGKLTWVPYGSCDGAHSYEIEVFPATCDKAGYTEYFCTVCGDCYQDHFTDPLGHDYWVDYSSEATCWSPAYTAYWCSVCGGYKTEEWGEMLPHSYTAAEYPATCYMGGFIEYSCIYCGAFYQETVSDPLPHDYEVNEYPASCISYGFTEYYCNGCGDYYFENFLDPIPHNYVVTEYPATCLDFGFTEHYCTAGCDDFYIDNWTDPIPW